MSQQPRGISRYQQFLHSDCGNTFAEYLGINVPALEYDRPHGADSYQYRYVRTSYISWNHERIEGEWCRTQKEAKASYKAALNKSKSDKKQFMKSIEANGFLALPDEVAA